MKLTIRDAISTVLAAAAVLVATATVEGWGWPLLASNRWGIAALLVLGMAMCTTAGAARPQSDGFTWLAGAIGVVTLGVVVYGFIAGTSLAVVLLATCIVLLWLVATVHHAVGGAGTPQPA